MERHLFEKETVLEMYIQIEKRMCANWHNIYIIFTYTLIQNMCHNITKPHWFSIACVYSGSETNDAVEVTSIFWVMLI